MADQSESAQLQFTVLYGSYTSSAAHCYLLEVSGVKILLDCGWDSSFDVSLLEPLEKVADKVSLVLISHANLEHLGALPYAYKKFKLTAPCYLTSPVIKLGQLALYDAVLNGSAPYTLDDIDVAITSWKELKYKQVGRLDLKDQESIELTPHASGRTLGGAVWSISQEPDLKVLYVSDIYQRRERFLDGLDLGPGSSLPNKPTLLIQDGLGLSKFINTPIQKLEQRDMDLIQCILECLRRGGDVLIPVDSTSRVLELLLILDEEWTRSQLQKSYELVFLTRVSSVIAMANSHIEWASRKLQEQMDTSSKVGGYNPLRLSQVAIVDSFEDAFATSNSSARIRPPRVIVCGGVDMESDSFSREVFVRELCNRPECVVLITCESFVANSLSNQLLAQIGRPNKKVTLVEERWVDLEGEELVEYLQKRKALEEERQREREAEVELMDFEQNIAQDEPMHDSDTNDLVPPAGTLQRTPSLPLERTGTLQTSTMEPPALKRAGTFKDMNEQEDILTFSFVPPQDAEPAWDEYGAMFDVNEIMGEDEAKKTSNQPTTVNNPALIRSATLPLETNKTDDVEDMGAKKKVSVTIEKQVRCDVRLVDVDGRMSPKDLFEFVDFVKPRKLVVVRSTQQDAERFAIDCQNKPACGVGLAPAPGECLDVAADSSVVRVRVADETLQTGQAPLSIQNIVVQRLRGKLVLRSMAAADTTTVGTQGKRRRVLTSAGGELPTIVPIKDGEVVAGDGADTYFVSRKQEPNWGVIMDRLSKVNIDAKLKNVDDKLVLMCGGDEVVVWKPGEGQFIVGGPLCDTYFTVRRALYDCFALV